MNVGKDALASGSDLWVLENNSENNWWNLIDFKSGFLLSSTLLFQKSPASLKIQEITSLIEMPMNKYISGSSSILLGTADHFPNKWIFLIPHFENSSIIDLEQIATKLKSKGVRVFTNNNEIVKTIHSRLSASLGNITFIE